MLLHYVPLSSLGFLDGIFCVGNQWYSDHIYAVSLDLCKLP